MRRRRLRRRLAVSTVVANMLMIAITLSLGAILVAWAGASYGGSTAGSEPYFIERQQALEEQFVIENVVLTKSNGYIDIFVRNVGATLVGVVAIYLNDIPETTTGNADFSSGNVATCKIPTGGSFVLGITPPAGSTTSCNQTPPNYPNVADFNLQVSGLNPNCAAQPWCSGDILYIVVASAKGNQATYTVGAP